VTTSTSRAVPVANYAAGVLNLPDTAIPAFPTQIAIRIGRCTSASPTIWPSQAVSLDFRLELFDGERWMPWQSGVFFGGISTNKFGQEIAEDYIVGGLEGVGLSTRRMRGTVTISGGTLRTYVDVTLSD
jgi:hypothetical protein